MSAIMKQDRRRIGLSGSTSSRRRVVMESLMGRVGLLALVLSVSVVVDAPTAEASFSGSNGKIAFASANLSDRRPTSHIAVADPDGSEVTLLTSNNQRLDFHPSWSADGEMIVFASSNFAKDHYTVVYKIHTMSANGTGRSVVYAAPRSVHYVSTPVWSPDRTQIAFCQQVGPSEDHIFVMDADGSALTDISGSGRSDCEPDWSPDGTMIAFSHELGGGIMTMNTDGSGRTLVVPDGASPSWSPDGSLLAYDSVRHHQLDVYVATADGSTVTRLTTTPKRDEANPAFSPDGRFVAFYRVAFLHVGEPVPADIWTVALADMTTMRITETNRDERGSVAWQPL